ncbi:MAG: DAK2 domain-containing protein [Rikenellaceae bacterium]
MKKTLSIEDFKTMWRTALADIKAREDEFSQLDAVIGDGDHGPAIVQALTSVVGAAERGTEFKSMLGDMAMDVMLQTSGSTSTLIGGLLLGMSDHSAGDVLDASGYKALMAGGLEGVKKQTKAMPGDKTMMDALDPAVKAIEACESEDIAEIAQAGAEAALAGAKATVEMKANFGRARNYGEKSIGYADSGATSWACMFSAFAKALN